MASEAGQSATCSRTSVQRMRSKGAAVRQAGGRLLLSVDDSGPGLEDDDRERLGERFFRVPGSLESGSGLGWSIVRRIAAVHRLQVQVSRSSELGGLAVHLIFDDLGL